MRETAEAPQRAAPDPREIRIEGFRLWGAGLLLVAALLGAFWLGRTLGRREAPAVAVPGSAEAAPPTVVEPEEETISFFDRAGGQGQVLEPRREAASRESRPEPSASPPPASPPAPSGPWYVQIFAGRDRQAAELVARRHRGKGLAVRLDAEREGTGSLYKVRVGGFPDREAADAAAERLRKEGASGAWVTRLSD
jgi:Cell division protein